MRRQGAGFLSVFHVGHGGAAEPTAETLAWGRREARAALPGRRTGHSAARRPQATVVPRPRPPTIGWRGPVTSPDASGGGQAGPALALLGRQSGLGASRGYAAESACRGAGRYV